jgi:hippurate hydrolase
MFPGIRVAAVAAGLWALGGSGVWAEAPAVWIESELPSLISLYQHFHAHPELSFHEEATASRFAEELRATGAEVTTGIGVHGVVGLIKNGRGPTVLLRSDLDALPVVEATQLPYASRVKTTDDSGAEVGVMHACGHDVHMTNVIGVTRYLAAHREAWSGTLMVIGQPAEERGGGAKAMLNDGLFTRFPKPDFALAVHVDSTLVSGTVGYRSGYALANVDSVDIVVKGKGGHGAYPHTTIDPIVMASQLVMDLQTVVSREIAPTEPAVITVGAIHGGTKHNIIADSCHLKLTVRSYSDQVRQQLADGIRRKAQAVAAGAGAPEPEVVFSDGTPAMFNNEALVDRLVPVFRRTIGEKNVVKTEPSMGGEDFSEYGLAGVPIFMFQVGSIERERMRGYDQQGQKPPSLHSPVYYPDSEGTLRTGLTAMVAAVFELMPPENR